MPSGFELSRDSDLTGYWSGEYWYDTTANPTTFSAHLAETAGALTGTTLERVNVGAGETELSANLAGGRSGASLYFTKIYQPKRGFRFEPIQYAGTSNDKFTVIQGGWRIPGSLSGHFIMHRASFGAQAEVKHEAIVLQFKR